MSRHGYVDDCDDPLAAGRWRQAVNRAIGGKRGQTFLRELAEAMDAMEDKRLFPGSFATPEGEFCALGALGKYKGIDTSDLGDDYDCDPECVGARFGIARSLAAEVMFLNDDDLVDELQWVNVDICGPVRPGFPDWGRRTRSVRMLNEEHAEQRWKRMREWVARNLNEQPSKEGPK